jgi:pimeloyl-ACP methyl ester carboxylesterase
VVAEPWLAARRAIIPDWFGCGYSDRPDGFSYSLEDHAATIALLLDHLDAWGTLVVGHSMGGSVGIALATARQDLVGRLALAEANLDAGGGMLSSGIASQSEEGFVSRGYAQLIREVRTAAAAGETGLVAVGMWQVADPRGLHRSAVSLVQGTQPVMRDQLLQLPIARAYIFGERSLPDPDTEWLPAHGIRVAVVPDAGHGMVWENPAGFAEALRTVFTS